MKVTFFNSAFVPTPSRLVTPRWKGREDLKVRFAVVEHDTHGVILIDGGYGKEIYREDASFPLKAYRTALRPKIDGCMTPRTALEALGRDPNEVSSILISHAHADHVCGLEGFLRAQVIMSRYTDVAIRREEAWHRLHNGIFAELAPSLHKRAAHFESRMQSGSHEMGLGYDVLGDGTIIAVPLPGHAVGHFGFFFPKMPRPLFYGVDVSWTLEALSARWAPGFPASLVAASRRDEKASIDKVADFLAVGGEVALCHDPMRHRLDWVGA